MKVVELCLSPDLGGLELYMYRCCDALSKDGVTVLPVISSGTRLEEYMVRAPWQTYRLKPRVRQLPLYCAFLLARYIDQQQVDAIHVHWGKDLPLAAIAKAMSKRKPRLVYTRQMMLTRSKDDPYHRFLYRQVDRMLTITKLLEAGAKERLPAESADKVDTLYYGVTEPVRRLGHDERLGLRAEWGVPEDAALIGLFGRIEPFKGQHVMLDALSQPSLAGKPIHLLIVGHAMDEQYLAELKATVEQSGLSSQVHFFDFVYEPQQWMQACDIVALTTRQETFGLVLAEAMRAGVAVIGSHAGGVPEIIEHNVTGLMFEPDDTVSLSEQIGVLVNDRDTRSRLAESGKRYADQHFSPVEHYRALRRHLAGSESGEEV